MAMTDTAAVRKVLDALVEALAELDRLDAPIAAAQLDAAIEALCRRYGISRESSVSGITAGGSALSSRPNSP